MRGRVPNMLDLQLDRFQNLPTFPYYPFCLLPGTLSNKNQNSVISDEFLLELEASFSE